MAVVCPPSPLELPPCDPLSVEMAELLGEPADDQLSLLGVYPSQCMCSSLRFLYLNNEYCECYYCYY